MQPLTPATPHVVIMVGIPGAGKSTFAEHFAKTFQAPLISYGAINQFVENPVASEQVALLQLRELTKTHRTLVYDGPTELKTTRQALVKELSGAGYQPLFVWVQTESAEAERRATRRRDGLRISEEEFEKAVKRFSVPTANEKMVVISGKHTYTSQLKIVLKHLAGPRPETPPSERPRPTRPVIVR